MKIDKKDKLILSHLSYDAKIGLKKLGKEIGIKKEGVHSRIKKLKNYGIIKEQYIKINLTGIGYSIHKFYCKFTNMSPNIKINALETLKNIKQCFNIIEYNNHYDIVFHVTTRSKTELKDIIVNTLSSVRSSLRIIRISEILTSKNFATNLTNKNLKHSVIGHNDQNIITLKPIQKSILEKLSKNPSLTKTELYKLLKISKNKLNSEIYKIKNHYSIVYRIDTTVLNMASFKVEFDLTEYKNLKKLESVIENIPQTTQILIMAGKPVIEIKLESRNDEIDKILDYIKKEMNYELRNINMYKEVRTHKPNYI